MSSKLYGITADSLRDIEYQTDTIYNPKELKKLRGVLLESCFPIERIDPLPSIDLELLDVAFDKLIKKYKDPELEAYFKYEQECSALLHNFLRLTGKESQDRDLWRFVSLYFINALIFRAKFKRVEKTNKNQLLINDKLGRYFFPRIWHTAEITRRGSNYTQNADFFRRDLNSALL